jgi:transposase-like protein
MFRHQFGQHFILCLDLLFQKGDSFLFGLMVGPSSLRLRMLQHAKRLSGNVSQTCRFFGVSRALYYIWKKRYEKNGLAGLRDQPRRPHYIRYRIPPEIVSLILRIREERRYGAVLTSLYLQRHYHA